MSIALHEFFFAHDIMQAVMLSAFQKSKKGMLSEEGPSTIVLPPTVASSPLQWSAGVETSVTSPSQVPEPVQLTRQVLMKWRECLSGPSESPFNLSPNSSPSSSPKVPLRPCRRPHLIGPTPLPLRAEVSNPMSTLPPTKSQYLSSSPPRQPLFLMPPSFSFSPHVPSCIPHLWDHHNPCGLTIFHSSYTISSPVGGGARSSPPAPRECILLLSHASPFV